MSPLAWAHLLPAERVLWARFLARYGSAWERFTYDERVGRGVPPEPDAPLAVQEDWITLTKSRIDVVGWVGAAPTIFEVAPRGGRAVLGALELYRTLWTEEHPTGLPPALVAVVGRIAPDLQRAMEGRGIRVFILPSAAAGA